MEIPVVVPSGLMRIRDRAKDAGAASVLQELVDPLELLLVIDEFVA
jgi:hypothetical protein